MGGTTIPKGTKTYSANELANRLWEIELEDKTKVAAYNIQYEDDINNFTPGYYYYATIENEYNHRKSPLVYTDEAVRLNG
jgi:hypothetical protein